MTDLVERATVASYERYFEGLIGCCEPSWDQLPQEHRDRLMDAQRAAISAMREPTEAMLGSAGPMEGFDCVIYEKDSDRPHIEWWQAMIDAARQENKP